MLFVAGGESSEVFDPVEEALDAVARPVEHRAEAGFPATMHHWRDVGRGSGGFDLPAQPVGVIGFVGEHDGARAETVEQLISDLSVMRLTGGQAEPDREPLRVDDDVDFGREPAA